MFIIFGILTGLFWTITYLLIIRQGFKDKTFGIPIIAICVNIAWEFTFAFIFPHIAPQLYINIIWFFLDVIIIAQVLLYWKSELAITSIAFYFSFLAVLSLSLLVVVVFTNLMSDYDGVYSAFSQNLLMSILFLGFLNRANGRGQSVQIAAFKMLGSICSSLGFLYVGYGSGLFLPILYILIFIFDLLYLLGLIRPNLIKRIIQFEKLGKKIPLIVDDSHQHP